MIYQVVTGQASLQETRPRFVKEAIGIIRAGAVGFGEMAAEHFSLHAGHPYISAPPDHPLFRLLADIAAGHDLPIDLHMEAITEDIQRENLCDISNVCDPGTENPETFRENITAFERLLRHNRQARIIWVHAGWDNTGHRTVGLTRQLLEDHPNLYIQLRPLKGTPNRILRLEGGQLKIRDEWLDVIASFPERFTIGLDSFFEPLPGFPEDFLEPLLEAGTAFVEQLYEELPEHAPKVAFENAVRLYQLYQPIICHRPGTPSEQALRINAGSVNAHLAHGDHVGPCG